MSDRGRWPLPLIFHLSGAALLTLALLALVFVVSSAMPARSAEPTYPLTIEPRWEHRNEPRDQLLEFAIFTGTGPNCPLVNQTIKYRVPAVPGVTAYSFAFLVSEQTCAVIGSIGIGGMSIDPTVWAYPIPWRGDCAWWANLDGVPGLGLGDFGVVRRTMSLADSVYWYSLTGRRFGGC